MRPLVSLTIIIKATHPLFVQLFKHFRFGFRSFFCRFFFSLPPFLNLLDTISNKFSSRAPNAAFEEVLHKAAKIRICAAEGFTNLGKTVCNPIQVLFGLITTLAIVGGFKLNIDFFCHFAIPSKLCYTLCRMSKWFQTPSEAANEPMTNGELGLGVCVFGIFAIIVLLACIF